jgi:hypothetical protein
MPKSLPELFAQVAVLLVIAAVFAGASAWDAEADAAYARSRSCAVQQPCAGVLP